MAFIPFSRRNFVKGSCYALALSAVPCHHVFGQTLRQRLDWETFKTTSQYPAFVRGIGAMRDNTNATDRRSWTYWVNSHLNYCPHGIPYFLAWHRGYVYYFEQYLRMVSGNSSLMLPYWDYYKNSIIPAEFTNPAPTNPLYVTRVNTNVSQALTQAPFSPTLTNFQRGTINSFEPSVERRPHDPVHDIIGAVMVTMRSPADPIFWLHHANIDRLWVAWVAAGNGRQMPAPTSTYWSGSFTYGPSLTMSRNVTISTRAELQYFYQNETFPPATLVAASSVSTPLADAEHEATPVMLGALATNATQATFSTAESPSIGARVTLPVTGLLVTQAVHAGPSVSRQDEIRRPAHGEFTLSKLRPTDSNRLSLGGAKNIMLNEQSVSVDIPIDDSNVPRIKNILHDTKQFIEGKVDTMMPPTSTIQIVLDNIRMTDAGQNGGYFYNVYLNLPESTDVPTADDLHLIGSVSTFAILSALHHAQRHKDHARGSMGTQSGAARLVFPTTRLLANLSPDELNELTVSFIRVSGDNSPAGEAITIGEVRIELSDDDLE